MNPVVVLDLFSSKEFEKKCNELYNQGYVLKVSSVQLCKIIGVGYEPRFYAVLIHDPFTKGKIIDNLRKLIKNIITKK